MKFLLATIQILAAAISLAAVYLAVTKVSLGICLFVALLAFAICCMAGYMLCTYDDPPARWRTGL